MTANPRTTRNGQFGTITRRDHCLSTTVADDRSHAGCGHGTADVVLSQSMDTCRCGGDQPCDRNDGTSDDVHSKERGRGGGSGHPSIRSWMCFTRLNQPSPGGIWMASWRSMQPSITIMG